jgi:putative tricarboxylic transport membrane protein
MVLRMPFTILAPIIFILCIVGGYAPTQDLHDVWLMLIFGVVGYLMRKLDYPVAPAVLAIVLGPLAETSMRQSLIMAHGSFATFFTRPISGTIMVVALGLLIWPLVTLIYRRMRS